MLSLLIRVAVLCSVVFAIVFALTRSLRVRAIEQRAVRERRERDVLDEIRDLRAAIERGDLDPAEYAVRAERVRRACAELGIDIPELPVRLPGRAERDV